MADLLSSRQPGEPLVYRPVSALAVAGCRWRIDRLHAWLLHAAGSVNSPCRRRMFDGFPGAGDHCLCFPISPPPESGGCHRRFGGLEDQVLAKAPL